MRPKIGIALGGGAARGWAHIGVLRALLKAGIVPDIVAGTSIGAVVGGCYVAERLDQLEKFARSLNRRRVLGFLDFNLAGTGLISGQRLSDVLVTHLGATPIEDLPKPFTAVATEIGSGHEVWLSRGSLVDAIRASYALPGIFRPVRINGRWLFDGALVNPIPVTVCRALGARYVIAVNLNADMCSRGTILPDLAALEDELATPPVAPAAAGTTLAPTGFAPTAVAQSSLRTVSATAGSAMAGARTLLHRQLFGSGGASAPPGISTVVVDAFHIVQDRIARSRLAGDPPDAIISPRLGGIGPFDFHKADDMITLGEAAALREIDDLTHELSIRARLDKRAAVTS